METKLIYNKGLVTPVEKFYSMFKFKYLPMVFSARDPGGYVEPRKKHNVMSYCHSCEMLRPPRSFHCSQCGVCVEGHDHHCPWVGNCIGHRNLGSFTSFLFWCAIHALFTAVLTSTILILASDDQALTDEV